MSQFERWRRGMGRGDWISTAVLTFLVAAAGAGVAIALTNDTSSGATTFVVSSTATTVTTLPATTTAVTTQPPAPTTTIATTTTTATTTTRPATTTVATTTTTATTPRPQPSGQVAWPRGRSGWSLFLVTYPVSGGRAAALASAGRAAHTGLPQVGVLDSGDFTSLRPGYYVVFSGVYPSQAEAESARPRAQASGFGNAYPRYVSP